MENNKNKARTKQKNVTKPRCSRNAEGDKGKEKQMIYITRLKTTR